jgi:protein-S-isoprenylcysteine O-methyltransferase Ste14
MNVTARDQAVKTSAWLLYTLIVLEILFMVSPFAAYYYSIYAMPLNVLQQSPSTAWLTMYVLPHFAYSDSWLANGLVLISWPLILTGVVSFVFGFCQIYWSKFTRREAVEVGLYRYIRHPQYVALAVIGLGTSLYWSRFIVIIAFVSMLYVYYFLARTEERVCLNKFGESYRDYMERTGMFFPRKWEARWRSLGIRLSPVSGTRIATLAGLYVFVLALTISGAYLLREHVINSLLVEAGADRVIVFLAPVDPPTRAAVARLLDEAALPGNLAYVAPSSWQIPELGFTGTADGHGGGGLDELLHPGTHGNALSFNTDRLSVLLVAANSVYDNVLGMAPLAKALTIRPIDFLELDLESGKIIEHSLAPKGQWQGIPVPTF